MVLVMKRCVFVVWKCLWVVPCYASAAVVSVCIGAFNLDVDLAKEAWHYLTD
jgi:hypothetical protein